MSYSNRMFEEELNSLREDNQKLRNDLDNHVQVGIEFSNIINEMLGVFYNKNNEDYKYFVERVEKALKLRPESLIGKFSHET
jgi:hypothetical protein